MQFIKKKQKSKESHVIVCLSVWVLKCIEILSRKTKKKQQNNKTMANFQCDKKLEGKKDGKTLNLKLGYAYACGYLDP